MMPVRSIRVLALVLLASCAYASPLEPGMRAVEQIRGRKFVQSVRNVTIDRSQLSGHLQKQMERSTPYPVADWATILRALQLVDSENEQILPSLLSLYEAQVLAFYDPHSHTYYAIRQLPKLPEYAENVIDPKMLEETVMIHELVHALQDQHFSLAAREKALIRDADANLAYHALLEGEAVLVMLAHILAKSGIELAEIAKDDAMLAAISSAAVAGQAMDASTPPYFAEMLKFPYIEGLKFAVAAYRRGGWPELDRVHANPPRSSREILHPDEYFTRVARSKAAVPFSAAAPEGAISAEHLGEFHWRFLVGEDNARGWVNDRAVIWRDGRVAVETEWESPERAAAFADAYAAFLSGRGIEAKVTREGVNVSAGYVAP